MNTTLRTLCAILVLALAAPRLHAAEGATPAKAMATSDFLHDVKSLIASAPVDPWRAPYAAFVHKHHLVASEKGLREFTTLRVLFEAVRDGGFFQVRWTITDQEPNAKQIWAAWQKHTGLATVDAECDEISALYAELARVAGVHHVGLFWPTRNHTIAAWDVAPGQRVLIPTTQIFLTCSAGFDETSFDATRQRTVYEYGQKDAPAAIDDVTAHALLEQLRANLEATPELLSLVRLRRGWQLRSSFDACVDERKRLVGVLRARGLTDGDRKALAAYAPAHGNDLDALAREP